MHEALAIWIISYQLPQHKIDTVIRQTTACYKLLQHKINTFVCKIFTKYFSASSFLGATPYVKSVHPPFHEFLEAL